MRARVELQGFANLSDDVIAEINYWLRFAPLACGAWTTVALGAASPWITWALVPFAALGALMTRHPFDAFYMLLVRRQTRTAPIPRYAAPRRFACALAAVWLTAIGACFYGGLVTTGRLLGVVLLTLVVVQVTTGFCVPSWLYRTLVRTERVRNTSCTAGGVRRHGVPEHSR